MEVGSIVPKPGTLFVKFLNPITHEMYKNMDHNQLRVYVENMFHKQYFWKKDKEILDNKGDNTIWVIVLTILHLYAFFKCVCSCMY